MLLVVVALSSCAGDSAIRHVLPVVCMTSYWPVSAKQSDASSLVPVIAVSRGSIAPNREGGGVWYL